MENGVANSKPEEAPSKKKLEQGSSLGAVSGEQTRCSSADAVTRLKNRELLKCCSDSGVSVDLNSDGTPLFKTPNGLSLSKQQQSPLAAGPATDGSPADQRRLVLHFDVRNTILVHDSVTNIDVEQSLNSFLTGVVWGVETATGGWEWKSGTPSLTPPTPDCMTYYKYMEKHLVKKPSDRAMLRRVTGDFTQEAIGKQFEPFFRRHLDLLRWRFPQEDSKLTMKGEDGALYHYILPSFFKLLHHLQQTRRDHAVVIRTYGLDAPNVLRAVEHTLRGQHPGFPQSIARHISVTPGRITRAEGAAFKCEVITDPLQQLEGRRLELSAGPHKRRSTQVRRSSSVCVANSEIYSDESEIYEVLSSTEGLCGFVDDFKFWQDNTYHHTAGKPLWIDLSDTSVHHVIFDDNIRVTDDDSIVDVRVLDTTASSNGTPVWRSVESRHQMAQLEDACLVQADLLQSTDDEDYFIRKLRVCEANYDRLLRDGFE